MSVFKIIEVVLCRRFFFITAMVYVYGRFLSKQLVKTISSDKMLLLIFSGLIQYHMIICYFMYIAGIDLYPVKLHHI